MNKIYEEDFTGTDAETRTHLSRMFKNLRKKNELPEKKRVLFLVDNHNWCWTNTAKNIAKHVPEYIFPRLVSGGVIICDDYGYTTCKGAKKAIDEFISTVEGLITTWTTPIHNQFIIKKEKAS